MIMTRKKLIKLLNDKNFRKQYKFKLAYLKATRG